MKRYKVLGVVLLGILAFTGCKREVIVGGGAGTLVPLNKEEDKYLLTLQGSHYEMGYQHGYLLAEQIKYSCSNAFYRELVGSMLGHDETIDSILAKDSTLNALLGGVVALTMPQLIYVPQEFRDEMHGIVDGAEKRLAEDGIDKGDISYERIVLTNMAFDVLCAWLYPIAISVYMSDEQKETFFNNHPEFDKEKMNRVPSTAESCDGFIATGDATATGGTIMTRDFMISPSLGNYAVMMRYKPDKGNDFVACNMPGFVGLGVGMNEENVAIGVDMISGVVTNPIAVGMGCLLKCRWIMQYDDTKEEGAETIDGDISVATGVPWIYPIADDEGGLVCESAPWTFFARNDDYEFDMTGVVDSSGVIRQIEDRDDLIIFANHYISKEMRDSDFFTSLYENLEANGHYATIDSIYRYEFLAEHVEKAIASDGITVEEAIALCNYHSPDPDNPMKNETYRYVNKDNPTTPKYAPIGDYYTQKEKVEGMRAVYDLESKTIYCLYNDWNDPWVSVSLND